MSASTIETLDLTGEVCPYTFVRAKLRLEELALGEELLVIVDHAPAAENVPRSLKGEGHEVVSVDKRDHKFYIRAIKRTSHRLTNKGAT